MEIVILSKQLIKPSSPTPPHLKTYKISLLDQYVPNCYAPLLVFYGPAGQSSIVSQVLKQSLSKTLTLYYPLAGQAKDNVSIDCNDNGAFYTEAKAVNCNLHAYLDKPDLSTLYKFLSDEITSFSAQQVTPGSPVLLVKCTHFACGGFAIGVFASHALFDAVSFVTFFKAWASIARQFSYPEHHHHHISPNFDGQWMFPQNIEFPQELTSPAIGSLLVGKGKFVVKRFVFDGSVIRNIKAAKADHNPSRVEVVSFILHKRIMAALTLTGVNSSSLGIRPINLRRKAVPELPYTSVGNFVWIVGTTYDREDTKDLSSYIKHTRKTISGIDGEFVDRLKGDKGLKHLCKHMKDLSELYVKSANDGSTHIVFNSWCNTGIYDVDFGWGKPLWVPLATSIDLAPVCSIQLIDTRGTNGGIEAWLTLDEESMNILECDQELCSLATFDPSPLQISSFKLSKL